MLRKLERRGHNNILLFCAQQYLLLSLVPRALYPGFGGEAVSPRFGHPHSQIPSVFGIPFSYYCSVLGIPRYPPWMPKSLVFWSSLQKNYGFRGKIENVLGIPLNIENFSSILKRGFIRKALQNKTKRLCENLPNSSSMTQN